jgi:glutamate/tyrosine decarboxylase-like PLP-dependent enzyme
MNKMFEKETIKILENALARLEDGFEDLPDVELNYDFEGIERVMLQVAEGMQDNYPYFHPYYAGQMLKPPHPIARVAYMLSLWINPNNHALDGGIASSHFEKEAVAEIARLFGWEVFLGHLTSGGTMANMEALWISGQLNPGKKVIASEQAHYTHQRISDVLGLDFQSVPCDDKARMDLDELRNVLDDGNVGTVVATIGTTGTGSVDPLVEILKLKEEYGFRLHADAAYGGYFTLDDNLGAHARNVYDHLVEVNSIVVDPHKHGLQPYGCGCVLYRDPGVGKYYKHESPYTYFTSSELHLGEISLECSRAGASAVALWATQKLLPMEKGGEFAVGLSNGRKAALALYEKVAVDERFRTIFPPELDILVWAPNGGSVSRISERSEQIFNAAARENLHLATFKYPTILLQESWGDVELDQKYVTCLRSCLMKPEHLDWVERFWEILDRVSTF